MAFEEGGERIKDLHLILQRVASVATLFDEDGISLRFMNSNYDMSLLENIRSEQQIERVMSSVNFKGLTPMGTELRKKVVDGIIIPKLQRQQYTKPHLVIVITDGQPAGEAPGEVFETVKIASQEVGRARGPGGVSDIPIESSFSVPPFPSINIAFGHAFVILIYSRLRSSLHRLEMT
jgi:hypothetical protein